MKRKIAKYEMELDMVYLCLSPFCASWAHC